MSLPEENIPPLDPDELSSRLIDVGEPPAPEESLAPQQRRRAAEIQLLHALLRQVHEVGNPESRQAAEDRIQRVMAAIRTPPSASEQARPHDGTADVSSRRRPPRAPRTRLRRWSALATAAAVLLALSLWWIEGPNVASAAVQRALDAALEVTDRLYHVTLEGGGPRPKEARLYVHGGDRFALQLRAPLGHFWIGSDGKQVWCVPPVGPVLVREDSRLLDRWLARAGAEMPFLQITTILRRMADHYELDGPLTAEPIGSNGLLCPRVHGRRRADAPFGPRTIDLWYDPKTGVAERVVLSWKDKDGNDLRPWKTLTFQREETEPLPDHFYTHAAHHGPARPVLHAPESNGDTTPEK